MGYEASKQFWAFFSLINHRSFNWRSRETMREKISRTSLVLAAIVLVCFALLPRIPGPLVLDFGLGAVLSVPAIILGVICAVAFTVPAVILGPSKYRMIGLATLPLLAILAIYCAAAERRSRQIIVRTVDSTASPISGARISDIDSGIHPPDFQPPGYTTDADGYTRLICATNSLGIQIQARGFFQVAINRETLPTGGSIVVRLRRYKLAGQPDEASKNDDVLRRCRLEAPTGFSDADVLHAISLVLAAPKMNTMPRWVERICMRMWDEAPARMEVFFDLGGFNGYSAFLFQTNGEWRVESAGRIFE